MLGNRITFPPFSRCFWIKQSNPHTHCSPVWFNKTKQHTHCGKWKAWRTGWKQPKYSIILGTKNRCWCNGTRLRQRIDGDCLHALGVWYVQACQKVKLIYSETRTLFMNTWTRRCSLTMGVCTVSRDTFSHLHSRMTSRTLGRTTVTRCQKLIKHLYVIKSIHTQNKTTSHKFTLVRVYIYVCAYLLWYPLRSPQAQPKCKFPLILWKKRELPQNHITI